MISMLACVWNMEKRLASYFQLLPWQLKQTKSASKQMQRQHTDTVGPNSSAEAKISDSKKRKKCYTDCSMWICLGWNVRCAMSDSKLRFDQHSPRCIGPGLRDLCGFYWLECLKDSNLLVQRPFFLWRGEGHECLHGQYLNHRWCIRYEKHAPVQWKIALSAWSQIMYRGRPPVNHLI